MGGVEGILSFRLEVGLRTTAKVAAAQYRHTRQTLDFENAPHDKSEWSEVRSGQGKPASASGADDGERGSRLRHRFRGREKYAAF